MVALPTTSRPRPWSEAATCRPAYSGRRSQPEECTVAESSQTVGLIAGVETRVARLATAQPTSDSSQYSLAPMNSTTISPRSRPQVRTRAISRTLSIWVVVCGALALAPQLSAQSPRRVVGFWAGLGGGLGPGGFKCDVCGDSQTSSAPTAMLTAGRTISSKLALGLEANGWRHHADAEVEHLGYLLLTAYLFPVRRSALHLDLGLGLARGTSEVKRPGGGGRDRASTLSPGFRLAAGYDFSISREVSFSPFVAYARAIRADLKINGVPSGAKVSHHLLQLGLGLFWNFSGAIAFPRPTPNQ
jgi:hypothetical protein